MKVTTTTTEYEYDTVGRLIKETVVGPDGHTTRTFEYDIVDRVVKEVVTETSYADRRERADLVVTGGPSTDTKALAKALRVAERRMARRR